MYSLIALTCRVTRQAAGNMRHELYILPIKLKAGLFFILLTLLFVVSKTPLTP